MKSTQQWGKHLRELVNASLDPMVYACSGVRGTVASARRLNVMQ
jgi:hypothetical protein